MFQVSMLRTFFKNFHTSLKNVFKIILKLYKPLSKLAKILHSVHPNAK